MLAPTTSQESDETLVSDGTVSAIVPQSHYCRRKTYLVVLATAYLLRATENVACGHRSQELHGTTRVHCTAPATNRKGFDSASHYHIMDLRYFARPETGIALFRSITSASGGSEPKPSVFSALYSYVIKFRKESYDSRSSHEKIRRTPI